MCLRRQRYGLALAAAALATLAKEPFWLSFAALAVLGTGRSIRLTTRQRVWLAVVPAAVAVGWGGYVRWRLGWPASQIQEFAFPFYGYVDAYRRGWRPVGNYADAVVAVAVLGVAVAVVVLWWRRRGMLLTAALPFALLVPLFSSQVLDLADNSMRAIGPALTLLVIECYRPRRAPIVAAGAAEYT